jgi:hypothetical protein
MPYRLDKSFSTTKPKKPTVTVLGSEKVGRENQGLFLSLGVLRPF